MNLDKLKKLLAGTDSFEMMCTAWEKIEVEREDLLLQNSQLAADVLALQADRKRGQEALHESEERFRFLVEGVKEYAIFRLDPHGYVVSWNVEAVKILGYQASEIIGKHFSCFFTLEDINCGNPEQDLKTTVAEERVEEDRWYVRSDGTRFWGSGVLTALRDEGTNLLGFSKIVRDMTAHKRTEQKIQEQATLLDIATDAILVQDLNNNILYWNQGAEYLYGWKADEAKDLNALEILYKENSPSREYALVTVTKEGSWHGELRQVTKSGKQIIVSSRWTLVRDEAEQPTSILIVNTDITAKKQLEAQFLRAQRLESIGALASGISHDLNNVLTPILLSAQLLQMLNKDERSQRLLQIQENSAKRGAALVKQVLAFAHGVEDERTILQVRHLILEIRQIVKETFPTSIELYTDISPELWTVFGDATQLYQVLLNLVVNARDAMPNGGTLRLVAENLVIEQNDARMNLDAQAGSYIIIDVSDTGSGIQPKILPQIFEPFFTTKEVGKGTGIRDNSLTKEILE
jgi:PAS domain S-box-containing protein